MRRTLAEIKASLKREREARAREALWTTRRTQHASRIRKEAMLREQALTLGLQGETRRMAGACNFCFDMPWRRHWSGCLGCGGAHANEVVIAAMPDVQSRGAFMCDD